jgi:hypothetical protein
MTSYAPPSGRGDRPPIVFLGVPMAINVRDILRTEVLATLRGAGVEVHVFTAAAGDSRFHKEFADEGVMIHPLELPRGRLFRVLDSAVLKLYVLLLSLRCETVSIMVSGTLRRNPVARWARGALRRLGKSRTSALIRFARSLVLKAAPDLYDETFRALRPDLVIGTRVLTMSGRDTPEAAAYLDRYLIMSAQRHGVPAMVLVSSWDNLTSKGFLPADVARLTVWNDIMRREAIELHDIPAPYQSREALFDTLGLDPRKPLVVYTTQTAGTVPAEPDLVRLIHASLTEAFGSDVQMLVRLHQLDRPERYDGLQSLPGLTFDTAGRASIGSYRDRDFDREELERLADTLSHADVVLNAASSISIDAAAAGTPVVAIAFDAQPGVPYDRSVLRYFDFTHQQNVVRSGGVTMATSPEAMVEAVRAYLEAPDLHADGRANLVRQLCYRLDGESGRRVAHAILRELGTPAPGAAAFAGAAGTEA